MLKSEKKEKYIFQPLRLDKNYESKNINFNIAKNVHTIRLKKRITVQQLSAASGINACHIYRIEKNEKHVGLEGIVKLANGLGVSIDDLIPFEETENKSIRKIKNILYGCNHKELKEIQAYLEENYGHEI